MELGTGVTIAKTAADLAKNENVFNKTVGLMGMLFPYAGLKQKAVDMYIDEIEKSDMSPEVKVFTILNTKKTFKKIKNQKTIADIAMSTANPETNFSEESGVSEEWLDRFMDSAGFVSTEELQLVWGKILANEFQKPGSTPPNMIRILSEITPSLAKAFRTICSMTLWILPLKENGDVETAFSKLFVPYKRNDEKLRELGLSFNVLSELETLGVIKFESIGGYISKGVTNDKILICIGDKLEVIEEYTKGEVPIGNVMLTSVGEALQAITEPIEIDGFHEMIKNYLVDNVKLAESHDYVARIVGDEIHIDRKDS